MTREEAIKILEDERYVIWESASEKTFAMTRNEAFDMAIEALENERPKGHWDFRGDNLFRCTECGAMYTYSQLEQLKIHTTDSVFPNYCPQCGADMKGVDDE